ncbi:hypothetical protein GHK80_26710 [Sinorhizobium medicae]|nr:hypothetical protein [Sinorhizobium medicae]MQX79586.1 hypothetical protein [Sinorhizobium medicae]
MIRYADAFVVFCENEEDARNARSELSVWLASRGLARSDEKTRISYLSDGFDFLGFNIRQYRAPETRWDWKLLIKSSRKWVKSLKAQLVREWRGMEIQGDESGRNNEAGRHASFGVEQATWQAPPVSATGPSCHVVVTPPPIPASSSP